MNKSKLLVALFVVSSYASALHAADYVLAEGQSDTISTNVVYETMTVAGDLSVYVPGGKSDSVKAVGFTTALNLNGGRLTIDPAGGSQYFRFGYPGSSDGHKPMVNLTNNASGVYASILIKNINDVVDTSLCCEKICLWQEAPGTTPADGIIDFARLEKGSLFVRNLYNYSACTGRVTIAGGGASYFGRRGRGNQSSFFKTGAFIVSLYDNSTWYCNFYNNLGDFNDSGVTVLSEGVGNMVLNHRPYNKDPNYVAQFRKGAYLNHEGFIQLNFADNGDPAYFSFDSSEIIGPNVTNFVFGGGNTSPKYEMKVAFAANVVQTLKNISSRSKMAYLSGGAGSKIRINADDDDRTVSVNIPSGNRLVFEKIGSYEMVVSGTTNFPHLVISEGTVRITEDCVVEDLSMSAGTELVADGCRVKVLSGGECANGNFATLNGGVVEVSSEGRTVFYDASVSGQLHFSAGTNVFSRQGIDKKYWRFTFTGMSGGKSVLYLRGLHLYGPDGSVQNKSLSYDNYVKDDNYTALSTKGAIRWFCSSKTNVASKVGEESYYNYKNLNKITRMSDNNNHYPRMVSPVIDKDNPDSWLSVEMYLKDAATAITGYNLRIGPYGTKYADSWIVYASDDGLSWQVVDVKSDVVPANKTKYYSYDGFDYVKGTFNAKELFHFTGYRTDGLTPSEEPLALQVDGDAMVDLRAFTGGQSVNALTVDLDPAIKGGEVFGAKIAATGTLTIKNAGKIASGTILPLKLPESIDGENIKDWSVVIDGKSGIYRAMLQSDGGLVLVGGGTMMILL